MLIKKAAKKVIRKFQKPFPKPKRKDWFVNYHTIESRNIIGLRDKNDDRKNKLLPEDFKDKVILDVGCNVGGISNFCSKMGAKLVYGIDFDSEAIKKARDYFPNMTNIFICEDLDNPLCFPFDVDTVLFLSVFGTKELEDRYSILSRLSAKCRQMYIEGHHGDSPYDYVKVLLKYTNFKKIEFLGYTKDENNTKSIGRPFFRCEHTKLDLSFLKNKLMQISNLPDDCCIGIIGKSAVGKTFIKNEIAKILPKDITILDDIKIYEKVDKKIILFDYRASLYLKGLTHLFYLSLREDIRLERLKRDVGRYDEYNLYLKAPEVNYNFLNFYSIDLNGEKSDN